MFTEKPSCSISVLTGLSAKAALDSVIFLDRLPAKDIPSLYKYALGTIVPTLFEGSFPFQILESLLQDTPVAFSNIPVVAEVVSVQHLPYCFNPYKIDSIQSSIQYLWENNRTLASVQKGRFKLYSH